MHSCTQTHEIRMYIHIYMHIYTNTPSTHKQIYTDRTNTRTLTHKKTPTHTHYYMFICRQKYGMLEFCINYTLVKNNQFGSMYTSYTIFTEGRSHVVLWY